MTDHDATVNLVMESNVARAMNTDFPTGIRTDMSLCVVVKTADGKECLVGGFGPFGVGQMWCDNEDGSCDGYAGFETAPVVERTAGEGQ